MDVGVAASSSVGLVLRRPRRDALIEPFYGEVVAGLDSVVGERGLRVLMQIVSTAAEELAVYERWTSRYPVAGVVLVDMAPADPRPALISGHGMPGVILGEPDDAAGLAIVRTDNASAMIEAVAQLAALGHLSIARVSGPSGLLHTGSRTEAFYRAVAERGLTGTHLEGDYSAETGADATRRLLSTEERPTAIVYDNDVMAVAGLSVALELGIEVPDELSIVAWDDSTLCRLTTRPLSAMSHDVHQVGVLAGRGLLGVIDGKPPTDVTAPLPVFLPRRSTGVYRGATRTA